MTNTQRQNNKEEEKKKIWLQTNVPRVIYVFEWGVGGGAGGGRICPKDAPLDLRSFEDEVALIHSDSRGESYGEGSAACKSH